MKAVAYCRYSTDNQTENSIAYQLEAIQKYSNSRDFNLVNIYTDEAKSGTNTQRDGLQRMLSDAESGKFDSIIIYDQSRLSRSLVDWFQIRDKLRSLQIKLYSCTETIEDMSDPSAFLSEGMKAVINQHFVLETRKKTIAGQTSKAKEGLFCGGTPPLGYDVVEGRYVINEYEAEAVRFIFESYANGKSYNYIIDWLKEKGYRSKRDGIIGKTGIYSILKNERYIGTYSWNKKEYKYLKKWAGGRDNPNAVIIENAIPPILDLNIWEEVKKRMNENKKNTTNMTRTDRVYLLSGILFCGKCGGSYIGFTSINKKGYETKYYICGNKRRTRNCDAKNVNGDDLEAQILDILRNELLSKKMIKKTADMIVEAYKPINDIISNLKKDLADCNNKINNLVKSLASGLDSESVREALVDLENQKKALTEKIEVASRSPQVIDQEKLIAKIRKDAEMISAGSADMVQMIKRYIHEIKITDERIIISAIGDLSTIGCGGTQCALLTFNLPRSALLHNK